MKKILATLFVACLFVGSVSAQENFSREIPYSFENNEFNYEFEVEVEGLYEVFIIGSNGERIAQPLKNSKLIRGTKTIKFSTKFWAAGQYRLVINKNGFPFRTEKFSIKSRK